MHNKNEKHKEQCLNPKLKKKNVGEIVLNTRLWTFDDWHTLSELIRFNQWWSWHLLNMLKDVRGK